MMASRANRCSRCGAHLAADNDNGRCNACQRAEREQVGLPPEVPATFWHDPSVQAALVARHIGQVIRAYRLHPHHGRRGLPQELVASWSGLSQAQVSRIEGGPPIRHLDRLIQWARILQIPEQHLWFKLPNHEGADHEVGDVDRRTLLTAAGTAAVGALAGESSPPSTAVATYRAPAELARALLSPSPPATVEPMPLQLFRLGVRRAWVLRQQAGYDQLAQLLPDLVLQAGLDTNGQSERIAIATAHAAVHAYNATSSLLKRLGDAPLAFVAADRAVHAAHRTDDPELIAAAMYRLANVLLADRRLDEAQSVALAAADLTEPRRTPSSRRLAMWGSLLLTAAVAAARDGDSVRAWELLGEANTGSRLLKTDHADMYAIFGPTNVAIHAVQIAVELKNGREAVRRSLQVDANRLPDSLIERRAQLLVDTAAGSVMEGNDEEAVATLQQAISVARQEVELNPDARQLVYAMLQRERRGAVPNLRPLATQIGVSA